MLVLLETFVYSRFTSTIESIVNCKWNEWEIGDCSKTCGVGTRTNTRTKKVEEKNGGLCEGESTLSESCNLQNCPGNIHVLLSLLLLP